MWWWILLWAVLLLGAAAALGLVGWRLVRQVIALGRQLGASAGEVSAVLAPVRDPYQPAVSVLVDPSAEFTRTSPRSSRGRRHRRP